MRTTEQRVVKIIAEQLGLDENAVTQEKGIVADLGADSLDTVELVMAMEDEFGFEADDTEAEKVVTVGDAIDFVTKYATA